MNTPLIGRGFGRFSHILRWTDFFPTDLIALNSAIGTAIGTEIDGPATITCIDVEPPFNIVGSNQPVPWRLLVVKGKMPGTIYEYQKSTNGWPRSGDQDLPSTVLHSKVIAGKSVPNVYNSSSNMEQELHFPWPDMSGPAVPQGETMTVFLTVLANETGVPGYAANQTYTGLTVCGVSLYQPHGAADNKDTTGRSIPRGRISGI